MKVSSQMRSSQEDMLYKIAFLCLVLPGAGALLFYGGNLRDDVTSAAERIVIRHIDSFQERDKRSAVTMPLSLVLALEDSTGSRTLNLTRGRDHNELDVFTGVKGEWRKKDIRQNQDRAVYFEKKSGSTLIVERVDTNKYIVAGYVATETGLHDVWPAHRHRRNEVDGVVSSDHIMKKLTRVDFGPVHRLESLHRDILAASRRKRSAVIQRTVELCFFSDFSDYSRFLELNGGDMDAALADMQVYYGFCEQAVRCIYSTLPSDTICIDIQVKKLQVFTTANEPAWVSESENVMGGLTHDGEMILDRMSGEVASALAPADVLLPGCDHWMLFTNTLPYVLDGGAANPIVGLATFRGLCKDVGVSLAKNTQTLCSCITAAHELGHSQGLQHDMDVGCSDADGFIMATSVFLPNETNPGNFFRFSECSIRDLVDFYNNEGNCSVQTNVTMDMFNETESGQFPGQVYDADEQCRRSINMGELCREDMNETGIMDFCRRIRCGRNQNNCFDVVPLDQTSCGNKQWCVKGVCVFNESAPARSENCPFGDDPDANCANTNCRNRDEILCCETCVPPPTDEPSTEATDATMTDATMTDATMTDATATDATATDATMTDATMTDATMTDATMTDATATDATMTDATATDATMTDATATDATATDATATDATATDATATDATATDATATDATATDATATDATATDATATVSTATEATATDATATDVTATDATATDTTATDATATIETTVATTAGPVDPGAQPGDVISTTLFIIQSCFV